MTDPIDFGKEIGGIIRDAIAPLRRELDELKSRQPEKGEPGKDADPAVIDEAVRRAVAAIPGPKDAEPVSDEQVAGQVAKYLKENPVRDGKDAPAPDLEALADLVVAKLLDSERLATLVDLTATKSIAEHFEANPVRHGRDADPEHVRSLIMDVVAAEVAALPVPKDGQDAPAITDEQIAQQVAKHLVANPPQPGADGVGMAGALIDRAGALIVTTTKGETVNLGKVVGDDGKDGRDGLSFDTATGRYDAERGFVLELAAGERKAEFVLPYMVHRGFWREGMGTKEGQSVTHDGALWIAKRANASKPCLENADDWYLAARKGRDGKDGKSVKVPQGPVPLGAGND